MPEKPEREMTSLTFNCPEGCELHDPDAPGVEQCTHPLNDYYANNCPRCRTQQTETLFADPNSPPYDPAMDDIEDL